MANCFSNFFQTFNKQLSQTEHSLLQIFFPFMIIEIFPPSIFIFPKRKSSGLGSQKEVQFFFYLYYIKNGYQVMCMIFEETYQNFKFFSFKGTLGRKIHSHFTDDNRAQSISENLLESSSAPVVHFGYLQCHKVSSFAKGFCF